MDTIWTPAWDNVQGAKYLALHNSLRKDIEAGKLAPGDQLPPVRDLAWKLGITPGTVARAYQKGVDEGVLSAVVGRGTFVADVAGSDQDIDAGDINHLTPVTGLADGGSIPVPGCCCAPRIV